MIIAVSAPRGERAESFFWALAVNGARVVRAPDWSAHRHDPLLHRAAVYAWHAIVARKTRRNSHETWYVEGAPSAHDAIHGHSDDDQPLCATLKLASAYPLDCHVFLLADTRLLARRSKRHARDARVLWGMAMESNQVRKCVF